MPIELIESLEETSPEYIIVSNRTSEVIFSSGTEETSLPQNPLAVAITLANRIRKAGGEVTIFKATKY
jgi:hypothetical protein